MIVLTTFDLDEYAFAAIRAGAAAFLLKDAAPEDAARRDPHACTPATRWSPPARPGGCSSTSRRRCPTPPAAHPTTAWRALTEREREVLVLVGRGRSNHEIAADLVVAEATVKTHVSRLLAKTGSRDRVQLVVLAYETGVRSAPRRYAGISPRPDDHRRPRS